MPPFAEDVPSPCVKICSMDPATGLCRGCHRTLDEIARWGGMSARDRREVLAKITLRARRWDLPT